MVAIALPTGQVRRVPTWFCPRCGVHATFTSLEDGAMCDGCGAVYRRTNEVMQLAPLKCFECEEYFDDNGTEWTHATTTNGEEVVLCPSCSEDVYNTGVLADGYLVEPEDF